MTQRATEHFAQELGLLMKRFRQEYELTYAEALGCLELAKFDLMQEMTDDDED